VKKFLVFSLAVGFFSLVISLLGGEFIVRHIDPQPTFRQSLKEGLSIFSPSNIVPFTVAQNQNSVHLGYTREFNHKVATNSLGFRGVKEIEKQKPEGTYRILVIGDSMTFGWGVEDNETFSSILERNLNAAVAEIGAKNKFEVINAGFSGGFTLDGFYSWLVNKGFELNPDLVLVSFFPYNDVSDLLEMEWKKIDDIGLPIVVGSLDTIVKHGRLARRYPTEWKYAIPVLRNSHLFILLGQALEKYSPAVTELIKKPFGVVSGKPRAERKEVDECIYDLECSGQMSDALGKSWRLFEGIKFRASQKGIKVGSLILTSPDQVGRLAGLEPSGEKNKRVSNSQPQAEIKNQLINVGIEVIDILPELTDKKEEQYFYSRDGHLNIRGHGRVAQAIFKSFMEGDFISQEVKFTDIQIQELTARGIFKF